MTWGGHSGPVSDEPSLALHPDAYKMIQDMILAYPRFVAAPTPSFRGPTAPRKKGVKKAKLDMRSTCGYVAPKRHVATHVTAVIHEWKAEDFS